MLKPGKTFKLSKTTKRMIGLMKGATADQRNQYKNMMIDAQLCSEIVVKSAPKQRDNGVRATNAYIANDSTVA